MGGGGQDMLGRRKKPGEKQRPPGWNVGGTGAFGESPPPGTSPPGTGPGGSRSSNRDGQGSGNRGQDTGGSVDLNRLAPLPDRPSLYPADSRYFLVPVTFVIELLTRPDAPAPERTAGDGSRRKGVGS